MYGGNGRATHARCRSWGRTITPARDGSAAGVGVATGLGVRVGAPASTLRLSGKRLGLKAVPVDISIPLGPIGIITLKNRTISPVAQLFIDCARKLARPFAKR